MTTHPNDPCAIFRSALSASLRGAPDSKALQRPSGLELRWHEHLIGCQDCRALLEREEALEVLLASLPAPTLPPALTERVLLALRAEREAAAADPLEKLLDLGLDRPVVPAGLAGRVLEGVHAARREAELDRVLEHARAVDVPADLAQRVLAASSPSALPPRGAPGFRLVPFLTAPRTLRVAAAAALVAGAVGLWQVSGPGNAQPEVSEALLADLDLLEAMAFDGIVIDTLNNLDPSVELLLESDD